jgi:uncharacterized protein (TIGR00255 family)
MTTLKHQSMTGFGRAESSSDEFSVTVEIKSVNHRFKDLRFKIPSVLNAVEGDLRRIISDRFQRGSFDIYINFKRAEGKTKFDELDVQKIEDYLQVISTRAKKLGLPTHVQATEFLRSEFYQDQQDYLQTSLPNLVIEAMKGAVEALETARVNEGEKLIEALKEHLSQYRLQFSEIEKRAPDFQKNVEEKLKKRFEEYGAGLNVDEPRFMQEVLFYLEKLDVQEEITRVNAHLEKFNDLLTKPGEVGRQLDFMVQELNRETNTMGSKSSLKEISETVVNMKVQLEKIREQGLNLE